VFKTDGLKYVKTAPNRTTVLFVTPENKKLPEST
jgi:hypothetical protein